MAPILSKSVLKEPQNVNDVITFLRRKSRPLLNALLESVQATLEDGSKAAGKVKSTGGQVKSVIDSTVRSSVRFLEAYCCLDLQKYVKGPKPALQGSLPMLFVLGLVGMLYNAFVFGYMPAAGIAFNSPTSLLFHAFVFGILSSFFQAVTTDPGGIPDNSSKWHNFGSPPEEAKERKRGTGEARWCRKSAAYKPDRAHYCQVLHRPVLRMDHHCPWLGNTIGYGNHKFFLLFLLYANSACSLLGVSVVKLLVEATLPALTTFCLIGAEGLTVLLSSILIPFLSFHGWLLIRNMTTIEFCESMRQESDESTSSSAGSFYDRGIFENICSVLGENPLFWLFPIGLPPGDGINFPMRIPDSLPDPENDHPAEDAENADNYAAAENGEYDYGEYGNAAGQIRCDSSDFLTWHSAAEFKDDLQIGCEFIGEKCEEQLVKLTTVCCFAKRYKAGKALSAKAAARDYTVESFNSDSPRSQRVITVVLSGGYKGHAGKIRPNPEESGSESSKGAYSGAEFLPGVRCNTYEGPGSGNEFLA